MKIKSYFADFGGGRRAGRRQEMGEEAMLMETRKAPPESQHLGGYEVVFGSTESELAARIADIPRAWHWARRYGPALHRTDGRCAGNWKASAWPCAPV